MGESRILGGSVYFEILRFAARAWWGLALIDYFGYSQRNRISRLRTRDSTVPRQSEQTEVMMQQLSLTQSLEESDHYRCMDAHTRVMYRHRSEYVTYGHACTHIPIYAHLHNHNGHTRFNYTPAPFLRTERIIWTDNACSNSCRDAPIHARTHPCTRVEGGCWLRFMPRRRVHKKYAN